MGGLFLCSEVGWGVGGNDRHFVFYFIFKATGKQSVLDSCSNSSSREFINSSNKQNQFKYFFVLFTLSFSLGMIFFFFFSFSFFLLVCLFFGLFSLLNLTSSGHSQSHEPHMDKE